MGKDYIQTIEGAERRYFTPKIEIRDEDEGTVEGIAAVVNKTTDLGWFQERIEKGAFDDVLKDDVVALFNHDPNFPLARTSSGTLELFITDAGDLGYRYKTPDRQFARDLADAIKSGDVSKSSFAFTIDKEEWRYAQNKDESDVRVIKKLKRLYDVSPVTYPAYNDTTVAARSLEKIHEQEKQEQRELEQDQFERDQILRELNLD